MSFIEITCKSIIILSLVYCSPGLAQAPDAAGDRFADAVAARQDKRLSAAAEALDEAEKLGFGVVPVGLERARLAVLGGAPDAAVEQLRAIAAAGFTSVGVVTGDPVLGTLKGYEGFDEFVAELSVLAYPCEHDTAFRAFDFWVGAWDVHVAAGAYAGSNVIEKAQRGCVLIENWSSASGGSGMSINYLDKAAGEWVQVWNDAGGNQINIRGGMTDDGMLLVGTIHYVASDTTLPFRGLWTPLPDGRVRQFFEQSNDGGNTWVAWFEGFYSRQ